MTDQTFEERMDALHQAISEQLDGKPVMDCISALAVTLCDVHQTAIAMGATKAPLLSIVERVQDMIKSAQNPDGDQPAQQ